MKYISSPQNTILKDLKALKSSAKTRRETGRTILEGIHLAQSYLDAGCLPEFCVISESSVENAEVERLLDRCDELQIRYVSVSDAQFRLISSVEHGVGLAMVVAIPVSEPPTAVTQNALLVDGVQDPGNLGAMLRTAAAAGVTQIYCSNETTSAWSPKALRAGMGAHPSLVIYEYSDLSEIVSTATIPVFATTLDGAQSLYETDLSKPCAWVAGNEGRGISSELLTLNITNIIIPQSDGVESLNVAAATAVCFFEQRRQQQNKGEKH